MIFLVLTLLFDNVWATNLTISPVVTTPLCYAANVANPLVPGSLSAPVAEIRRTAWPLTSPPVNVPLTINGEEPVGSPEVICMTGCAMPPCYPIHSCAPSDLWWSAQYARGTVVVAEGDILRLPDSLTPPPVMAFLWDTFIPLPSVSPSPSVSPIPSPCPSFAATAVTPCKCDQPSVAIAAYVFVGILTLAVFFLSCCVGMLYSFTSCPYCGKTCKCGESHLTHLKECEAHLKLFTPLTQVTTCVPTPPASQVVFATSSNRRLVKPLKEAELVPFGSGSLAESIESDEVTVGLRPPTPPNLAIMHEDDGKPTDS